MKNLSLSLTSVVKLSLLLKNIPGNVEDTILRYNIRNKIILDKEEQERVSWNEQPVILQDGRQYTSLQTEEKFADEQYEILLEEAEWKMLDTDVRSRDNWTVDHHTIRMFEELEAAKTVEVKKK